jgi:hypothetical protein
MAYKELSRYMSDDGKREASVYKLIGETGYRVSVKNDAGTSFASEFDNIDKAEEFAEDWVLL